MSDFKFYWYFFLERKILPADQAFKFVVERLKVFKKHTADTTDLYRKEYSESKKKIDGDRQEAEKIANQRYKEIMGNSTSEEDHGWAMHDSGLDDLYHHYSTVYESLQRNFVEMADFFNKSSLVSLYGLLETDMRRLCFMLQSVFNKKISVQHLSDKNYLQGFLLYFELVIELPITGLESHISKLTDLQYIRNRIVHEGGLFPKEYKDKRLTALLAAAKGLLILTPTEDSRWEMLRVNKIEFLTGYYETLSQFYNDLLWMLEAQTGYPILISRLSHFFGGLATEPIVTVLDSKKTKKNGYLFILKLESKEFPNAIICKWAIESTTENKVDFINRIEGWPALDEFIAFAASHQDILLRNILDIYIAVNARNKITCILHAG